MIIHPQDFESTGGRNKIISLLHSMDKKIHMLEQKVGTVSNQEGETEKDIQDILHTEGPPLDESIQDSTL